MWTGVSFCWLDDKSRCFVADEENKRPTPRSVSHWEVTPPESFLPSDNRAPRARFQAGPAFAHWARGRLDRISSGEKKAGHHELTEVFRDGSRLAYPDYGGNFGSRRRWHGRLPSASLVLNTVWHNDAGSDRPRLLTISSQLNRDNQGQISRSAYVIPSGPGDYPGTAAAADLAAAAHSKSQIAEIPRIWVDNFERMFRIIAKAYRLHGDSDSEIEKKSRRFLAFAKDEIVPFFAHAFQNASQDRSGLHKPMPDSVAPMLMAVDYIGEHHNEFPWASQIAEPLREFLARHPTFGPHGEPHPEAGADRPGYRSEPLRMSRKKTRFCLHRHYEDGEPRPFGSRHRESVGFADANDFFSSWPVGLRDRFSAEALDPAAKAAVRLWEQEVARIVQELGSRGRSGRAIAEAVVTDLAPHFAAASDANAVSLLALAQVLEDRGFSSSGSAARKMADRLYPVMAKPDPIRMSRAPVVNNRKVSVDSPSIAIPVAYSKGSKLDWRIHRNILRNRKGEFRPVRYEKGESMLPPNDAFRELTTLNHRTAVQNAGEIFGNLMLPHTVQSLVHDVHGQGRPRVAVAVKSDGVDPRQVMYAGAWHGIVQDIPGQIIFSAGDGRDSMYQMRLSGSVKDISDHLNGLGISQSYITIPEDQKEGDNDYRVYLFDPGSSGAAAIRAAASSLGAPLLHHKGTAVFIGGKAGEDHREAYRSLIRAIENEASRTTGVQVSKVPKTSSPKKNARFATPGPAQNQQLNVSIPLPIQGGGQAQVLPSPQAPPEGQVKRMTEQQASQVPTGAGPDSPQQNQDTQGEPLPPYQQSQEPISFVFPYAMPSSEDA